MAPEILREIQDEYMPRSTASTASLLNLNNFIDTGQLSNNKAFLNQESKLAIHLGGQILAAKEEKSKLIETYIMTNKDTIATIEDAVGLPKDNLWLTKSSLYINELHTVGKILFADSRPLEYDEAILLDQILINELEEKNNDGSQ